MQEMRPLQRMLLAPYMQQSIQVLTVPLVHLGEMLLEEIAQNEVLEVVERKSAPLFAWEKEEEVSLFAHLTQQAREVFHGEELKIAEEIIGNLNEKGFLEEDVHEKEILYKIQRFDPVGVGAKDARESLLIQLGERKSILGEEILREHYRDFLGKKWESIGCKMGLSVDAIEEIVKGEILPLNPFPGLHYQREERHVIFPEIAIEYEEGEWQIVHPKEDFPSFRIKEEYLKEQKDPVLKKKVLEGKRLIYLMYERVSLFHKGAKFLIQYQGEYLKGKTRSMRPLLFKELSAYLSVSPSTVSRAFANKYIETPIGIFPFSHFFPEKLPFHEDASKERAKQLLKELIAIEDAKRPLCDEKLKKGLEKEGIFLSRRAVTKYRQELAIPDSRSR